MYAERISTFRGVIGGANAAADVTEISGQLLSMLERVDNVFRMEKMYVIGQGLAPVMESLLDELRSSLAQGGNLPLLTWVRWAAGEVAQSLENSGTPKSALDQLLRGFAAELRELAMRANVMMDYWSISRDRDEILKQAREAVKEAQQSASKAKMSAGITGEAKLSEHFGSYASGEKTAANGFRIAAIASVVLAFIVAIAFGPIEPNDWTHLTYRLASVAGAGTLARTLPVRRGSTGGSTTGPRAWKCSFCRSQPSSLHFARKSERRPTGPWPDESSARPREGVGQ